MNELFYHAGLSITTFVVTNIDDLIILSAYFASPKANVKHIVLGQYAGIIMLIGISLVGIILGEFIDQQYVRYLGLVPIYLGMRELVEWMRKKKTSDEDDITVTEV